MSLERQKCTFLENNWYLLTDKNTSSADTSAILDNTASYTNTRLNQRDYTKIRTRYKQD